MKTFLFKVTALLCLTGLAVGVFGLVGLTNAIVPHCTFGPDCYWPDTSLKQALIISTEVLVGMLSGVGLGVLWHVDGQRLQQANLGSGTEGKNEG